MIAPSSGSGGAAEAGAGEAPPLRFPVPPTDAAGAPARSIVRIHLVGRMQATSYLGKSILPRSRKAKAALAFMCLAPDRQLSRARLAAILWDRSADAQARLSLRQALHEISGAMGELAPELLTLDRETMALNTALCWIDAAAMVDPAMPPGEFLRSDLVSLCAGELLEGFDGLSVSFDQWLLTERARLTWQLRKMFETELHRATEGGFPAPQRASIARQLIAFDATHEGASRALMRALADSGERAQALREYERCREPCSEASTSSPGDVAISRWAAPPAASAACDGWPEGESARCRPIETKRPSTTPTTRLVRKSKRDLSLMAPSAEVLPLRDHSAALLDLARRPISEWPSRSWTRKAWTSTTSPPPVARSPRRLTLPPLLASRPHPGRS